MANLKVFRFEEAEVAAMEEQVKRSDLPESADVHFRFALGKAYEDKGDFDLAWHYYDTGNQRQRKRVFHDPVAFEARHRGDRRSLQRRSSWRRTPVMATNRPRRSSSSACRAPVRR